jgi:Polysaccharide deacetylase
MSKRIVLPIILAVCLAAAAWMAGRAYFDFHAGSDVLILLLPDGMSSSDPRVAVWLDAASEEGLHIKALHDSSFLRPLFGRPQCAGVILPDSIHQRASDLLIRDIRDYVANGGNLLLVYDAATESLQGFYADRRSRLSDLAGVDYALYSRLGAETIRPGSVSSTILLMKQLGIPPGKYFPFFASSLEAESLTEARLRRYQYGDVAYPSFVTAGDYAGQVLLRSDTNVAAGVHRYGKGSVLFVNLPLSYLKGHTDGLPLHVVLRYFGVEMLSLPRLLAVPDGTGGLVLNWHVDSNAAISALEDMESWKMSREGPYSIHITAGPDTYAIGDGKGFDVLHNPESQRLVRLYTSRGDEIGSHGGWIHNYFAARVETAPYAEIANFLQLNKQALEQVTGRPVLEYSAPNGDQPQWVTAWLESHGFLAYYFTGDSGMPPTQGYREGRREGRNIWAFPIMQLDRAASFEEFSGEDVSYEVIERWLEALTSFVVDRREVRLLYFHPPGILPYRDAVDHWVEQAAQVKAAANFRWYTMAEMANFLNSRKQVNWKVTWRDGFTTLRATSSGPLTHETWSLPRGRFDKPAVIRGSATVFETRDAWLVDAGKESQLELRARSRAR